MLNSILTGIALGYHPGLTSLNMPDSGIKSLFDLLCIRGLKSREIKNG